MPVITINYDSELIIPDLKEGITKQEIIEAGLSGNLLASKSSFYHIRDIYNQTHPLILISPLSNFKLNNETNHSRP